MACYQSTSLPSGFSTTGKPVYASQQECLDACKEGACCDGTSCSVKPQCQCQGTGQTFQGAGTTCGTSTGACCYKTSGGATVCEQKLRCSCVALGGKFYSEQSSCSVCDEPALANATITASTAFGSVSINCSERDGAGVIAKYGFFPCGFSYGSSPTGGNQVTSNSMDITFYTRSCFQTEPTVTEYSRQCDVRNDAVGTRKRAWNVVVRARRTDGFGNFGIMDEQETVFRILVVDGVVSVVTVMTNKIGPGGDASSLPPYSRCKPCGFNKYGGTEFVDSGRIDCCETNLSATLTVT